MARVCVVGSSAVTLRSVPPAMAPTPAQRINACLYMAERHFHPKTPHEIAYGSRWSPARMQVILSATAGSQTSSSKTTQVTHTR
jgi:hypothetical protein